MNLNRRQMLFATGAGLLGHGVLSQAIAAPKQAPKKVLFFTKSAGFEHSVIARKEGKLSLAERILTEAGKEHGFEVVASKDGRLFDPDKIGEWDAFAFQTTGDLTEAGTDKTHPMSKDGKKGFLDAIRGRSKSLNADITVGHHSAALVHLANIAARVGRTLRFDPRSETFLGDDEASAMLTRRYRDGHWSVPKMG
ncbi:hypothetical protein ACYOEI_16095 [Singulisphaera rosea]